MRVIIVPMENPTPNPLKQYVDSCLLVSFCCKTSVNGILAEEVFPYVSMLVGK
jgi:hypothetical protein